MQSPGPERAAPVHVADLLTRAAADRPDQQAVVDVPAGTTLTWSGFDLAASAEAARLRAAGVRPGDRVVIALPDGAGFCVALFGALRADAVAVPVGPGSVRRELDIIFSQAGPTAVIAVEAVTAEAAAEAGARLLGPPATDATPGSDDPQDPAGQAAPSDASDEWGGEALAVLVFTSGTTGRPRGVQLSHRALLANREQAAALRPAPVTPTDRVLLALPLFHVYGMAAGLLQVCWAGATVVLPGRFDPSATAEVLVSSRVSVLAGVPSMFRALLDVPAPQLREALGGIRLCTSGGAPLPTEWLAAFHEATGLFLHEGYGLSEGGPVITTNNLGRPPKPGSVGRPLPGVELRLVDANGAPLVTDAPEPDDEDDLIDDGSDPSDDTGLIALRGPNLFSGYWPAGSGGPDDEGWFRTADVGYLDADGDLHLVDRSSDLVIV
ncbi:MAG: AMP-binding protein, partial [Pseudonocardia sp.]|nr:AMP-binding protein [Pseudonocardia sp.]